MSITGLAIIYIIIWWIVFFVILPIDVKRTKTVKIDGEDPGSPENPKMLKGPIVSLKTNQASADATIGSAKMNVETLAA